MTDQSMAGTSGQAAAYRIGPHDDPDRYELNELRSRGGEGELWSGHVDAGGQALDVAVKVVTPPAAQIETESDRLRTQAELLRSLDHPNVVTVREAFEGPAIHPSGAADPATRALYLVMNWVNGESVDTWVGRNPERDVLDCTRVISRLASAVDYLHSGRGTGGVPVLHRDIKPANVIVDGGEAQLVDFGFARFAAADVTVVGTPAYLAPEVIAGAPPSEASDRYGLGATAYFLFAGEVPTPNDPAAMHARLQAVPGIEDHVGFADHVMAMLSRDPAARPSDVVGWAQGLALGAVSQRFSTIGGPGAAAGVAPAQRKSGRRWVAVGGVVLAVLLVAGGVAGAIALTGGSDDADSGDDSASAGPAAETAEPGDDADDGASAEDERAAVPDMLGLDVDEATAELEDAGFDVDVEEEESGEPEGTVLEQSPRAGNTTETEVTLTVAVAAEAYPDVVGLDVSEATDQLERLGLDVTVRDVVDPDADDGEVVAQDPEAGEVIGEAATLSVARPEEITYLSDMAAVEGWPEETGVANISGTNYVRSVLLAPERVGETATVGYDLGRDGRRFTAAVGLRDDAPSDAEVTVEVLGDGRVLFSQTMALGEAADLDVDVTGVLRLTLSVTTLESSGYSWESGTLVFGDAAVSGATSLTPSTTVPD